MVCIMIPIHLVTVETSLLHISITYCLTKFLKTTLRAQGLQQFGAVFHFRKHSTTFEVIWQSYGCLLKLDS